LSLVSWNILAPCWVDKEWYPTVYDLAADYETRINTIASQISLLNRDVTMIQEAQEDMIPLLKEKLGDNCLYEFASNIPTSDSINCGLLTLIRKDWKYAKEVKVINGILDPKNGEAIQIINIPSKNIYSVNVHLDDINPLVQGRMIKDKCNELLGTSRSLSVIAGDLNAEKDIYNQFGWIGYRNVFEGTIVQSYYADPQCSDTHSNIDHIFYNPKQVMLVQYGKAWDTPNRSLEESLKMLGSDHIYVWATFNFI
jgi:endonuclease/exonuclease/phosphatase family metal-dependent hydrolase